VSTANITLSIQILQVKFPKHQIPTLPVGQDTSKGMTSYCESQDKV